MYMYHFVTGICGSSRCPSGHLCLGPVLPTDVESACDGEYVSGPVAAAATQVHGSAQLQQHERGDV